MPEIFYLYLLGHLAGDFYLQSKDMSERKQTETNIVLKHALYYWAAILVVSVPLFFINAAAGAAAFIGLGLAHYIIDSTKYIARRIKKIEAEDSILVFLIDQILHIGSILGVSYLLNTFIPHTGLTALFFGLNISYITTVKFLTVLLLMGTPANIIFKKIFKAVKQEDTPAEQEENGIKNAGAKIGTLERIISSVMFFLGQYAAVAIVLTAKSIARYKRLSDDPGFAEYYLIGTLSSIAYAILITMLFFQPV